MAFCIRRPSGWGTIRAFPEDFIVQEVLAFEPSGTGQHAFLQIRKIGENTDYVARQLARFADVRQRDIGFAGSRTATRSPPNGSASGCGQSRSGLAAFASASIEVLQATRHARKLQRGALSCNRFGLTVREWRAIGIKPKRSWMRSRFRVSPTISASSVSDIGAQCRTGAGPVPGKKAGREQRSFICRRRVRSCSIRCWRAASSNGPGIARCRRNLHAGQVAQPFQSRYPGSGDSGTRRGGREFIRPASFGARRQRVTEAVAALEAEVIGRFPELAEGLQDSGVEIERRALRVNVPDLALGVLG
ncbi:tRNA pseudouridine(13) synthase TruD [Methylomicrobium agile]|uniref:tRNA pseudouridine(13) synthase TruD n=1 Tax=Methylomicrobium agile TaxID=39774 RepID=UPI0009FEFAD8